MSDPLSIVIAGGGTGGHLFPGLALADELRGRGASLTFVGTSRGLEAKVVPQAGYPLELLDVAGLKGQGFLKTLRSLLRLPLSLWQALRLLRRLRPRVVVGVGGYASGPLVLVAALLGIPTVILEQNSVPGITNKILGRLVRSVVIAFPGAGRFFPQGKLHPLGNPIRAALVKLAQELPAAAAERKSEKLAVLVLGGSQGAHAVNDLFCAALAHWVRSEKSGAADLATHLELRHQTGAADREAIEQRYRELGLGPEVARVDAFIDNMGQAYADCALMVGRAGATTLAELTAVGRPALLIPFPQAADDHQTENARWLLNEGAAELLPQASTTPAELCARLQALCGDRSRLGTMAAASRRLGRPEAAKLIAEHVLQLAGER